MSNARNLGFNSRQDSLSSLSSSMESLSSTHADSYWSTGQQELVPTRSAFTIPRSKVKTSDYETGFSAAEYDEDDMKQPKKVTGKVRKVRLRLLLKLLHLLRYDVYVYNLLTSIVKLIDNIFQFRRFQSER